MTAIRSDIPPLPERMRGRPVDPRGFPVPWFVAKMDDGQWDFRVIRPHGFAMAVQGNICWICGCPLGVHKTFVIGPMCAINRVTSEPPSHLVCAQWATRACPFMLNPEARRSSRPMAPDAEAPAGIHTERNPGAMCLWTTRTFEPFRVPHHLPGSGGMLIRLGDPSAVEWWARGRAATRAEVLASISSGIPLLKAAAEAQGVDAVEALSGQIEDIEPLLPAEAVP